MEPNQFLQTSRDLFSMHRRSIVGLCASLLLLLSVWFTTSFFESETKESVAILAQEETVVSQKDPFLGILLRAKAAIVWDVNNGEAIYLLNSETPLPLASLTKLMTALIAEETLPSDYKVSITESALNQDGDSGFFLGEVWDALDLIKFTLVSSSNDGASALASAVLESQKESGKSDIGSFSALMNEKALSLGLAQTFFINASGLDSNVGTGGGYSSLEDIVLLLGYMYRTHQALFEATTMREQDFISQSQFIHRAKNTNEDVEKIPGIVASKTGLTDLAGGNLAIIFEAGPMKPIIVAVLGSTKEERFSDVEKLVWAALEEISQLP